MTFRCNLCGAENQREAEALVREVISCNRCESSGRLRALAWLVSDELFGVPLTFPQFPSIKAWAGLGMSDIDDFAAPLASKFSYSNTYYHKPPLFDITKPDPEMDGKFDFIISSEVLEHVPNPVSGTFATLYRMLKPNGVLFLTVPYSLEETVAEHFPEIHDFGVTQLRDSWVLINRTRDGRLQTFDNLVFHGGPGSTLEMRVFNEKDLHRMLTEAGFGSIRIAGESYPEFGILPDAPWSLPIAARKGARVLESAGLTELSEAYRAASEELRVTKTDLANRNANYAEHVEWANTKVASLEQDLATRTDWAKTTEQDSETHLEHIAQLRQSITEWEAELAKLNSEFEARTQWAVGLQRENEALTARCNAFENDRWVRLGRRLGITK